MLAERARLLAHYPLVNRFAAFGIVGALAACGQNETPPPQTVSVPLVWQTSALKEGVSGFSIAERFPPALAVAYEAGGVQVKDFDGTDLSEPAPLKLDQMSEGTATTINDVPVDLYTGMETDTGALKLLVMGDGLVAPYDLPVATLADQQLEGFCASSETATNAVFDFAYWTKADPSTLSIGKILVDGDDFRFEATSERKVDRYISACGIKDSALAIAGPFGVELGTIDGDPTLLETESVVTSLSLVTSNEDASPVAVMSQTNGELWLGDTAGRLSKLVFSGGVSISVPDEVGVSAVMESNSFGGFPNGLIAFESRLEGEPARIVFIDLGVALETVQAAAG